MTFSVSPCGYCLAGETSHCRLAGLPCLLEFQRPDVRPDDVSGWCRERYAREHGIAAAVVLHARTDDRNLHICVVQRLRTPGTTSLRESASRNAMRTSRDVGGLCSNAI